MQPAFPDEIRARLGISMIAVGAAFLIVLPVMWRRRMKRLRQLPPHQQHPESEIPRVAFTGAMDDVSRLARRSTRLARVIKDALLLLLFVLGAVVFGVMSLTTLYIFASDHFSVGMLWPFPVTAICWFFSLQTWRDIRVVLKDAGK